MISQEDMEKLKANDGYTIDLDGEKVPIAPGCEFDYDEPADVFTDLIKSRGVEATAAALGFSDGKEMALSLAEYVDYKDRDMDDFILDSCNGKSADDDPEAEYADHELDRRLGK